MEYDPKNITHKIVKYHLHIKPGIYLFWIFGLSVTNHSNYFKLNGLYTFYRVKYYRNLIMMFL